MRRPVRSALRHRRVDRLNLVGEIAMLCLIRGREMAIVRNTFLMGPEIVHHK